MEQGEVFERLIEIATNNQIRVLFCDLKKFDGLVKGRRIAIRSGMRIEKINEILAHELAHFYLHYDKGDTINSPEYMNYEEQADRAATLLLDGICQRISPTFVLENLGQQEGGEE